MMVNFIYLFKQSCYQLFRLICIEFKYASHSDFHKLKEIITVYFSDQTSLKRFKSLINMSYGNFHTFCVLKLFILIDTLFDEYFLKRCKQMRFLFFTFVNLKLHTKHILGFANRSSQHITNS